MASTRNNHTLRKVSAFLYLITLIITLIVVGTVGATFPPTTQDPTHIFPLTASALAATFVLSLTITTFLPTRQTPSLHLSATFLSTLFTACMIAITYQRRSKALLPCTAGDIGHNPYVQRCQLSQAVFWSAVLAAVAFAGDAILAAVLWRQAKRERGATAAAAEHDAPPQYSSEGDVEGEPPQYPNKGDVEGEAEWSERVGRVERGGQ